MKKSTKRILNYSIALFVSICCVCGAGALGIIASDSNPITPTPPLALPQTNISTVIVQTSSAAQTQTLIAAPFTFTPFIYETPTLLPPVTLAPTWTPIPTNTLIVFSTLPPPEDTSSQCICTRDVYNCGDPLEQTCYNYCNAQGYGDIHRLDGNNNGIACEDP